MLIKTSDYVGSFLYAEKCPTEAVPEFAFIGRSNVGKSSLINYLTQRKKLVKVSVTPGKTQMINFFKINKEFNFVDLPGYGYAKISREQRAKWTAMIRNYVLKREQLLVMFQLIDSRIPPQEKDLEFINWMGENNVPVAIVFTKADKPGSRDVSMNVQNFKNELLKTWDTLPPCFITSSEKNNGRDAVLEFIDNELHAYAKRAKQAEKNSEN